MYTINSFNLPNNPVKQVLFLSGVTGEKETQVKTCSRPPGLSNHQDLIRQPGSQCALVIMVPGYASLGGSVWEGAHLMCIRHKRVTEISESKKKMCNKELGQVMKSCERHCPVSLRQVGGRQSRVGRESE